MADSLLYIAIDFGTSFSGYAFSFLDVEQTEEQTRIPYWDMECGVRSHKTPTCILFDEEQNFQNFGYDAMTRYTRMIKQDQAMRMYLFEHFKMELYNNVSILTFSNHTFWFTEDTFYYVTLNLGLVLFS